LPFIKKIEYVPGYWQKHAKDELNTYLESGKRLEDLPFVNWNLPFAISKQSKEAVKTMLPKRGRGKKKYVGIYCSSNKTSRDLGGWNKAQWLTFIGLIQKSIPHAKFVFIGAEYDDLTKEVMADTEKSIDAIGCSLDQTIEILKNLHLFVGLQSGLGCLSTYFDKKTVMLFAAKYQKMHNAFTRKSSIDKTWKGCEFCDPNLLMEWLKAKNWL
jgi:ADP-heptose:LPS heptosyltransferase